MRSFVILALGLLTSTAAFAGHGHGYARGHARPAETQVVYVPAPVVHVAPPTVRPDFIWIDGHYEGRVWVAGHWEVARPALGVSVSTPLVHIDVRR